MKNILFALIIMLSPATLVQAQNATGATMKEEAMIKLVNSWFERTAELAIKGETGIEDVMALMHDDMSYIHTEYGANMDRDGLIAGFKRRLTRASSRNSKTEITNRIMGKNMMATSRNISYERRTDNGWEARSSEGLVAVFEFRDGKIWRITEYWD